MTIKGKKALKKLERRRYAFDGPGGDRSPSGQKMQRPGSQNRSK